MGKRICGVCKRELDLYFTCTYCHRTFCVTHHLPENHNCPKLPKKPPPHIEEAILGLEEKQVFEEAYKKSFEYTPRLQEPRYIEKKKRRYSISAHKVLCIIGMLIVAVGFVPAFQWSEAFGPTFMQLTAKYYRNFPLPDWFLPYLVYIPSLFVLAMSHELLHALAWWYYGYSATPIPILIPPILGITIGEKPHTEGQEVAISIAPILLTFTSMVHCVHIGQMDTVVAFGLINAISVLIDLLI